MNSRVERTLRSKSREHSLRALKKRSRNSGEVDTRKGNNALEETKVQNMSSEYSSLKVVDLKRELKSFGLGTSGTKDELIVRLRAYKEKLLNTSTDMECLVENIIESDILDEEDVLEGELDDAEEEEVLKKTPDVDSSLPATANKSKEGTNNGISEEASKQEVKKKVVLVRKTSVPILGNEEKDEDIENKEESSGNSENTDTSNERKVVKLTNLSMEDRLKLRAKKFGVNTVEDRKAARAARFGIQNTPGVDEPLDVLKNRAQRFGTTVSSALSKQEFDEKMRARKARFGLSQPPTDNLNYEERKKSRIERFKNA